MIKLPDADEAVGALLGASIRAWLRAQRANRPLSSPARSWIAIYLLYTIRSLAAYIR